MVLEVPPAGEGFWEVFQALQGERTYSGGMVPIPNGLRLDAIRAEARARDLIESEAVFLVQMLDSTWLAHQLQRVRKQVATKNAHAQGQESE